MSEPEQTKHKRRLPTPRLLDGKGKRAALVTAVILLLAASAAAPFLLKWRQSQMRRYSGAEVNYGVKLLYDAEALGEFEVRNSFLAEDGTYREHIAGRYRSEIRLWRDFERPKLPCREAAEEKYPDLTDYSRGRVRKNVIYSERCSFSTDGDNGEILRHTFVIARRGGWDYYVDISVPENEMKSRSDYIDGILDTMYFLS